MNQSNSISNSHKNKSKEEEEEQIHFYECIIAYKEYYVNISTEIERRERHFINALSRHHKEQDLKKDIFQGNQFFQDKFLNKFKRMRTCALENQKFLLNCVSHLVSDAELCDMFPLYASTKSKKNQKFNKDNDSKNIFNNLKMYSSPHHMSKITSLLHQFVREWSEEGAAERETCFDPILMQLKLHLPLNDSNTSKRVLCPGVGLGRLAVEIVSLGYSCQGNEFSYHMLFASDFVLNKITGNEQYKIYPWIDDPCNAYSTSDIVREIKIPDIDVHTLKNKNGSKGKLSMTAGEFLEVYNPDESNKFNDGVDLTNWDCIVTCFFLDTAPDVFVYITRIYQLLKPGGIWINHGPLLWHWYTPDFLCHHATNQKNKRDQRYNVSVELTYEEIKFFIEHTGFVFINETKQEVTYCANAQAMVSRKYKTILFVCKKPLEKKSLSDST